jgi:hypothetical protein
MIDAEYEIRTHAKCCCSLINRYLAAKSATRYIASRLGNPTFEKSVKAIYERRT